MSVGTLKVERREWDTTEIPVGTELRSPRGDVFLVVRATYLHRQSRLTRLLTRATFGLWPFGRCAGLTVVCEDRSESRKER